MGDLFSDIKTDSPIIQGIKSVGVGQKGSRDLDSAQVLALVNDFKKGLPTRAQIGAFFAGLYHKGIGESEKALATIFAEPILSQPEKVFAHFVLPEVPLAIKAMGVKLFQKKELNLKEAYQMGKYLFTPKADAFICGVVASALRVRYETDDEYRGLLTAVEETTEEPFKKPLLRGRQLSS